MLKKLAKYGNSTTLVIDKAILELLNMDESSIVKLQTDGKSLIITPIKPNNSEKVTYDNHEAMNAAKEIMIKNMPNKELNKESLIATQKEFSNIFTKYSDAFRKFCTEVSQSENFQNELLKISEKYDPVTQSEDYVKEYNKLTLQFCPEFAGLEQEITEVSKKYSKDKNFKNS